MQTSEADGVSSSRMAVGLPSGEPYRISLEDILGGKLEHAGVGLLYNVESMHCGRPSEP